MADMSVRRPSLALLLALGGLAGCSGGGPGSATVTFSCNSQNPKVICLASCNLGCTANGCSQTDIAQNQIVIFQFSEDVDPNTVSPSSIRFRTPSGEQPVGEFFVNGKQVEFVPTLSISGGQTFFGFSAGETYTLTIPGGDSQTAVVRSTSGKPFERTLLCTMTASLGIVDFNGVAPAATLIVPTASQLTSAPRDTDIVLEFNEMIDATPFLSGTQSPVLFSVRRTRVGLSGERECDPNSNLQTLAGTQQLDFDAGRGVSILSFRPSQILPGNICVEIAVTDGVQDLSGRPAQPQSLSFLTVVVPLSDFAITETFADETFLDTDSSAAQWAGGTATFFRIGGDGRHGPFSTSLCVDTNTFVEGKRVFTLNTDNTTIPASNTTSGAAVQVTDGRFQFSSMVVPSTARLRFIGTKPPIVSVSGVLDVLGHIDVAGSANAALPTPGILAGQPGAAGGAFGGAGGKGGDKISAVQATTTGATAANQGVNGQDANLLAGHGYFGSRLGTGGRGSTVFPASGLNSALYYGTTTATLYYTPSAAAGGSGGGFLVPGTGGFVVSNNHPEVGFPALSTGATATTITVAGAAWIANEFVGRSVTVTAGVGVGQTRTVASNTADTITVTAAWVTAPTASTFSVLSRLGVMGPPTTGGTALQLLPFPAGGGLTRASEHFLAGGSGGGGSASQACCALGLPAVTDRWAAGMGGGGGGGAMALRAGRSLRVAPAAKLLANGGGAPNSIGTATVAQSAPAGAGSGGSIVLQSGNTTDITGTVIDVRGGTGSSFNRSASGNPGGTAAPAGVIVLIAGGNGAPGNVRLEAPVLPALTQLVAMQPAATLANVAVLSERDNLVACRSKFYSTQLAFGPEFSRYEIRGTIDGTPFLLSDDPAVSTVVAGVGAPVRAQFQAAQIDVASSNVLSLGPWRDGVRSFGVVTGIASDGLNGFRFILSADFTLGNTITLDEVVVVYRN